MVSSPEIKNISLFQKANPWHIYCHSVLLRGALAIVTNVGRVAVDAEVPVTKALKRTAKTCGPDARYAGVKFRGNKLPGSDGGKRASAHRGERVISRKATAQGMSDCLRCPVCSCAQPTTSLRTGPRVQRASGIPCALGFERARDTRKPRAQCAARARTHIYRHCERSEAIHSFFPWHDGLLPALAMTVSDVGRPSLAPPGPGSCQPQRSAMANAPLANLYRSEPSDEGHVRTRDVHQTGRQRGGWTRRRILQCSKTIKSAPANGQWHSGRLLCNAAAGIQASGRIFASQKLDGRKHA